MLQTTVSASEKWLSSDNTSHESQLCLCLLFQSELELSGESWVTKRAAQRRSVTPRFDVSDRVQSRQGFRSFRTPTVSEPLCSSEGQRQNNGAVQTPAAAQPNFPANATAHGGQSQPGGGVREWDSALKHQVTDLQVTDRNESLVWPNNKSPHGPRKAAANWWHTEQTGSNFRSNRKKKGFVLKNRRWKWTLHMKSEEKWDLVCSEKCRRKSNSQQIST